MRTATVEAPAAFDLALKTTEERLNFLHGIAQLQPADRAEEKRISQRLYDLSTIKSFFADGAKGTFLGFQGWGGSETGVSAEYRRSYKPGVSQIDGFHWKDEFGNHHYHSLGSNISRFNGTVVHLRLPESSVRAVPIPRSQESITNSYGLVKRFEFSSELNFQRVQPSKQTCEVNTASVRGIATADELLSALEKRSHAYQQMSFDRIENAQFSLELNKDKEYFKLKIKGLRSWDKKKRKAAKKRRDQILGYLYKIKQEHPECNYDYSPRRFKESRIHLNASSICYLQGEFKELNDPHLRGLRQITHTLVRDTELKRALATEKPVREFLHSKRAFGVFGNLKFDAASNRFTYQNSDRRGRYFVSRSELIRLLETDAHLALTIKGKPGLLKKLWWKWGFGIPQFLSRSRELAHCIQSHGLAENPSSFFVDGADDLDLVMATNKESLKVVDGVSTFMILPMAIDMLDDALHNEGGGIKAQEKRRRFVRALQEFIKISQGAGQAGRGPAAMVACIEAILNEESNEGLEFDQLRADFETFKESGSPEKLDELLRKLTNMLADESEEISEELKESRLMYKAIFCMASGLKIHFAVGGLETAMSAFKEPAVAGAAGATAEAVGTLAFSDYLNLLANPFAATGQIMCAIASAQKTSGLIAEAKELREIEKRVQGAQACKDTTARAKELSKCLEDCAKYMARERGAINAGVALNSCLVAGQILMALGTICSSVATCGSSLPASVLSTLTTLKTLFSAIGLGGTLVGAGGDSIREAIVGKRFGNYFNYEDIKSIYDLYATRCRAPDSLLVNGATKEQRKIRNFVLAKNAYVSQDNYKIYRDYVDFQEASVELRCKPNKTKASEKYKGSRKYVGLQNHMAEVLAAKKQLDFSGDKLGNARSLYELFFDEPMYSTGFQGPQGNALDDWKTLVSRLFKEEPYRTQFQESLTERLLYSSPNNRSWYKNATGREFLEDRERYFREYHISKKRRLLGVGIPKFKKGKTLRRIKMDCVLRSGLLGLLPFCHDAIVDLVQKTKTKNKEHLRGVEYGSVRHFIKTQIIPNSESDTLGVNQDSLGLRQREAKSIEEYQFSGCDAHGIKRFNKPGGWRVSNDEKAALLGKQKRVGFIEYPPAPPANLAEQIRL